ncbi:DUF890 family protein [Schizosaccharomyces japonicus yFS275]|uniref:U6 small nuclear RNA (adenine-(43)-N(6))-methyltransferase n=1 Tax=Schizosaccharomyces japonicus (strain yFS275 / FY16936) TaxID=402676 RepID=B6JZC9_SCHJY|nr:DUF890 family protein [Schizosaccharomyces japonicus yFS275]EEB06897.2 DUF890 family protein [Schizosaccharomyces japonicus yFS275]
MSKPLDVNFKALADENDELRPFVKDGKIDFWDMNALQALTRAILSSHFHLDLHLGSDCLCPMVVNRHMYITFINELLCSTCEHAPETVFGLDIGTGATCIYPLLGCATYTNWIFYATDIDETSLVRAAFNIRRNGFEDRIWLLERRSPEDALLPFKTIEANGCNLSFTMCNPPFYATIEEAKNTTQKLTSPYAVCTGAPNEMVTKGGETEFVLRILRESLQQDERRRQEHKSHLTWYTCMLGKLSTVERIVVELRASSVNNYALHELIPGQTKRWIIAWSFCDQRPPPELARPVSRSLHKLLPWNTKLRFLFPLSKETNLVKERLALLLDEWKVSVQWEEDVCHTDSLLFNAVINAANDTWSRKARRKRMKESASVCNFVNSPPVSVLRVCVQLELELGYREHRSFLTFRWKAGKDPMLFESFANTVYRKLTTATA